MNFGPIVAWLLRVLLRGRVPAWVLEMLVVGIPQVVEAIVVAVQDRRLDAADTIRNVQALLDESLDSVPEWSDESEERRDVVIDGLTELAMIIYERADRKTPDDPTPIALRKASRKMRRTLKREIRRVDLERD